MTTTIDTSGFPTVEVIAHKAWVDHMVDNGLAAPTAVTLDRPGGLRLWISPPDAAKWVDSIAVDDEREIPGVVPDYVHVHVDGRLPLLGHRVELHFIRRNAVAAPHLRSVTA